MIREAPDARISPKVISLAVASGSSRFLAAISPFRPHVWVALRNQSKVRVGSQGSGCLDADLALWRALSHHNPANDAECEQGRRYNPRIPHHGILLLAVGK
jgi:hypothetical protein